MGTLKQFRDPQLSLWQSAVDEVVAVEQAGGAMGLEGGAPQRPDTSDPMLDEATSFCAAAERGQLVPTGIPKGPMATEGLVDQARYCSGLALKLGKSLVKLIVLGNRQELDRAISQFEFGDCDPRYARALLKYAEYIASGDRVPYRRYRNLNDYVIEGKLPDHARVALLGDWGTGRPEAKRLLSRIKANRPDVVIHLGDVYYSGTAFEMKNYFLDPWFQILDLKNNPIPTFTMSGNHDMYSGGGPYYDAIDKLAQPASYFCLRNKSWQFIAMDTGLHAIKPGGGMTYLEDAEAEWVKDKIRNAGGRRTVLLSHHQLFSASEDIGGQEFNTLLYKQLSDVLPKVDYWFWAHEHDLVVFKEHLGLKRGRCIGHGAFPVGNDEIPDQPANPDVPVDKAFQLGKGQDCYFHGYAMMEIQGSDARISYYQDAGTDQLIGVE
ncbi:MAG: metallophosphoesterase [Actinobacteria bacterium]|nr:metallophosphoesterase [Actinomycetota bacterium]